MFSVRELASWCHGRVVNDESGSGFEGVRISGASTLADSGAGDVAFFFNRDFEADLPRARPGVLVTGEAFVAPLAAAGLPFWKTAAVIACADPYLAMARLTEKFAQKRAEVPGYGPVDRGTAAKPGRIHPSAVVDPTAEIGSGVVIGAHCVVGEKVRLGAGVILYPGCVVGAFSSIDDGTVLFANVSIYEFTQIGKRVRVHAGSVIGADGFGYAPIKDGDGKVTGHQKIYHLGRVVVGDDVEIGANSCVDRGTFGDTTIAAHVKIDNLVQVGHNCRIDEGAVVCGEVGLAGGAMIGKYAYVGGGAGIGNRVSVGDRASVGAHALVSKDVAAGAVVIGNPQREFKEHFKVHAMLNRLLAERKKK